MTQNPLFYARFFSPNVLRNSVVMATPKVPGDKKLFERVCYMLKLKVTKFQLPTPDGFRAVLKTPAGKFPPPPPPFQNRVNAAFAVIGAFLCHAAYLQFFPVSLETEYNAVCFISYIIPRLCSTFTVQSTHFYVFERKSMVLFKFK